MESSEGFLSVFETSKRNATFLAKQYQSLSDENKSAFNALPIERQLQLLAVPVKRQSAFRKHGVDRYVSDRIGGQHMKHKPESEADRAVYMQKITKRYEKRKYSIIADKIQQGE